MSAEVTSGIKLRFRYWNCRGRVQALRYILADIAYAHPDLDYQEEPALLEKAMESWFSHKADATISGPFHNLPILHWNDKHLFGQTLPIGQLLARKFDLYGHLTPSIDDKDVLHSYIDGVVSCAYTDVIINVLQCIWLMVDFVDETNPMNRLTKKIPNDLKALDELLQQSSTPFYYDQSKPTIADYFVLDAFTAAQDYCKKLLPKEEDCQALRNLERTMKARPGLAKGVVYTRFTGSPQESEYIAKLAETQT